MDMDLNKIQADYFDVKNGVISFTSVLIYAPLVLLVLYIIYLFLPLLISGVQGGQNITLILKTILKRITQVFYLVFRPIIFILKKIGFLTNSIEILKVSLRIPLKNERLPQEFH